VDILWITWKKMMTIMNKYDNSMQINIQYIQTLEGNHMLPETKNREPIVSWNGPEGRNAQTRRWFLTPPKWENLATFNIF
jgi:hypothetical protein